MKQQKREVRYFNHLVASKCDCSILSQYVGTVETNKGKGYLYELACDHSGQPSKDLHHYFQNEPELRGEMVGLLRQLGERLLDQGILFYDLNCNNILCRELEGGELKLTIIDGVGDVVFIPILNYLPRARRRKIVRRWNRSMRFVISRYPWIAESDVLLPEVK